MEKKLTPTKKNFMKSIRRFLFIIILLSLSNSFSQKITLGGSGGLLNGGQRVKFNSGSASSSDTGFYLGLFSKIPINEKFSLYPEIDYGNLNDNSFGSLSLRLNYYILPKFYLQAGPQLSYMFETTGNNFKKTGLDASFGLGYDVTNSFHIQARYAFEVTNRVKDLEEDITSKLNWLFVGVGYSFW